MMKCFLVAMLSGIEQARDISSLQTRIRHVPHVSVNLNLLLNVFVIRYAVRMTVCEKSVWANGAYRTFDYLIIAARDINSSSNFDIFCYSFNVYPRTSGLHHHISNGFTEYSSMQCFIQHCTLAGNHNITWDSKRQLFRLCNGHLELLKKRRQKLRCCSVSIVIGDGIQYDKKIRKKRIFLDLLKGLNALRTASIKLFAEIYCSNNFSFSVLSCLFTANFYLNKNCITLICIIEINTNKREDWIERLTEKEHSLTEIFKFSIHNLTIFNLPSSSLLENTTFIK